MCIFLSSFYFFFFSSRRRHTRYWRDWSSDVCSSDLLDALNARNEWNPADYAVHLSRRARGLPFWFSLAVHGTDAYTAAIEQTLAVTRQVAEDIRARQYLDLLIEPDLSVLVFRRRGWSDVDYDVWAARLFAFGGVFRSE